MNYGINTCMICSHSNILIINLSAFQIIIHIVL